MAILALDVGERRIGVAVSGPDGSFALPLRTLDRTNLRADLGAIVEMAQEYDASTIVVGDPLALGPRQPGGHQGAAGLGGESRCLHPGRRLRW